MRIIESRMHVSFGEAVIEAIKELENESEMASDKADNAYGSQELRAGRIECFYSNMNTICVDILYRIADPSRPGARIKLYSLRCGF